MKQCSRCGTEWRGFGHNPRPREICEDCGAYLHSCANCHHFDQTTKTCTLDAELFNGATTGFSAKGLNYCDLFRMSDPAIRTVEGIETVDGNSAGSSPRESWENLFRR